MDPDALQSLVAELLARPGHEKVRSLLFRLLTDGLRARSTDIDFERRVPEVRGRIDALLGRTVFEMKSDLRREMTDARTQLANYLPDRTKATGHDFLGVATDGAEFHAFVMRDGALAPLGPRFVPTVKDPRRILGWLESVVTVHEKLAPEIPRIGLELGRESPAYARALQDLEDLWRIASADPEARLKRDVWDRLLSVSYGADVGSDVLFLQHTYLTVVAKTIATLALLGDDPPAAEALMTGAPFRERGVAGAVEGDFFDWVLFGAEGRALVERIARHVRRFDFSAVDVDVLKGLYEGLIDPAQRHDLGEYYTPDWLAARVVAAAVRDPLAERVIDPACGSGTFLFHAVRAVLRAADAAGLPPAEAVARAVANVAGIDVHPVAVIFARATYLLALAPTLRLGRPASLTLPVYLGDALQWSTREFMGHQDLEIVVPAEKGAPPDEPGRGRAVLRFPFEAVEDPGLFDETLATMLRLAEQDQSDAAFLDWATRRRVVGAGTLVETFGALRALQSARRDHIWGYVARNLSRPIWLSSERRKADVVLGNPPWVAYRAMSRPVQDRFKAEARAAGVYVGGKSATASDLSAYFFARSVALYMKRDGRIAFVMPYAAMSREPYALFRRGAFKERGFQGASVRFTGAWAFPADVQPLFPVPACVLFAERSPVPRPLPATVLAYAGRLPRRDAHEDEAARALAEAEEPWPADDGATRRGSPYRERFRNGATLFPRRMVIVEEVPTRGRLGGNPAVPLVRGREANLDKPPWNTLTPLQGPVERQFVRPVLLGECIAPHRVLDPLLGIIPMIEGREAPLDARTAEERGFTRLADWLCKAEHLWHEHGDRRMAFVERLDYWSLLRCQFPLKNIRVAFAKSGVQGAAVVLHDYDVVIENVLYWAACESIGEARYLASILNSESTRIRAERWQSTGQWGARHFDKVMFNLPIPLYDEGDGLHRALAAAAERAEAVAAAVPLKAGEHFTRARRRIREALAADGVAGEIDGLVARLLDG